MDLILYQQLENRVTELESSLNVIIRWVKTQNGGPEIQSLRETNYGVNNRQTRLHKKTTKKIIKPKFQLKSKLVLKPIVVISKEDRRNCESVSHLKAPLVPLRTPSPDILEPLEPCSSPAKFDETHIESKMPISEDIELSSTRSVCSTNLVSSAVDFDVTLGESHQNHDMIEVHVIKPDPAQYEELDLEKSTLGGGISDDDDVTQSTSKYQVPTTKDKNSKAVTQKATAKKKKKSAVVGANGTHNCEICNKIYSSWILLQLHTKKAHNIYIYTCATCKQQFNTKTDLITHRQLIHKKLQHKCPICTKHFTYKEVFYDHIIGVHQEQPEKYGIRVQKRTPIGPQKCNNCDKTFDSWKKLYAHMSNVKCERRNPEEVDKKSLKCVRRKPGEDNKSLICEICGTTFKSNANLRAHKNSSIHNTEKKLVCTECGQTFTNKYTLQKHVELHNRIFDVNKKTPKNRVKNRWSRLWDNNGPFICELCGKSLRDWRMYLNHRRNAHNPEIIKCEICNKEFKNKKSLRRHTKTIHVGSKDHVCGKCGEGFTRSDKLRIHDKKIHS